jgi:hypothetical protein
MSFDDFERFSEKIQSSKEKDQEDKIKNLKISDKGYKIIPIDSYE